MDCRTARILLEFCRPATDDCAPEDAQALELHLAECSECAPMSRTLRALDQKIAHAMQDVPIPEGLHQRLSQRFERRPAWYRRPALQALAAAAAVLLAVGLSVGYYANHRAIVNVAEFPRDLPQSAPAADAWLVQHGVRPNTVAAPVRFRYELLTWIGFTEVSGQRVPVLVFSNGTGSARVYLLPRSQFNVDELARSRFDHSSVYIDTDPGLPCGYIVECPGGDPRPFQVREQPGA